MRQNALVTYAALPFFVWMLATSCNSSDPRNNSVQDSAQDVTVTDSVPGSELFSRYEAQKVLGTGALQTEFSHSKNRGVYTLSRTFVAVGPDDNGDTGRIYFLYKEFDEMDSALHSYSSIKAANEHLGITELDQYGDEAYYHTDNTAFRYVMIRKDNKEVRIKLSGLIETATEDWFLGIAKSVANDM